MNDQEPNDVAEAGPDAPRMLYASTPVELEQMLREIRADMENCFVAYSKDSAGGEYDPLEGQDLDSAIREEFERFEADEAEFEQQVVYIWYRSILVAVIRRDPDGVIHARKYLPISNPITWAGQATP